MCRPAAHPTMHQPHKPATPLTARPPAGTTRARPAGGRSQRRGPPPCAAHVPRHTAGCRPLQGGPGQPGCGAGNGQAGLSAGWAGIGTSRVFESQLTDERNVAGDRAAAGGERRRCRAAGPAAQPLPDPIHQAALLQACRGRQSCQGLAQGALPRAVSARTAAAVQSVSAELR